MRTNWILPLAVIVMLTGTLSAQEKPLEITSTFSSGFYSSYTRGGGIGDQSVRFVPAGTAFDIGGYFFTPDLLNFSIQPEYHYGPQASDAGFQGGNGGRGRVSLLRHSIFPITFRYSNMQLEDVYFGSLSQLSSYTLKNRNKDLGVTAELNRVKFPHLTVDWGQGSVDSKSGIVTIPDYRSRTEHLNADGSFVRWGWNFEGFAHKQQQTSDLIVPIGQEAGSSSLEQKIFQYQASIRRGFLKDSEFYMDGGSQSTATLILIQPIDLTTRYANANLRLFQRRRWKVSLHAGYTSNIAGLLLTQVIGGLTGNGSVAPDAGVLQPFQHRISNLNLSALTSVDMSHGISWYGSADRTEVLVPGDSGLHSRYISTTSGMIYARSFSWGSLSGQYGREFGIGSVIGQTGTIEGQNYSASVQRGNRDGLELDLSVHGNDQSVRNALPTNLHSVSPDASVSRRIFGAISAQIGGGWQQSTFTNSGNSFRTKGFTAHAGIENPRFQLGGSLNSNVGNSMQIYSELYGGIGAESAVLTPLHLIPSDFRGLTLSLHANPTRKFELAGMWTRSVQHLEGVVANDFEIIDVHATYHFRRIQLEVGFFRSYQIYSSYLATYPATQRGRFYFRVLRPAKIL